MFEVTFKGQNFWCKAKQPNHKLKTRFIMLKTRKLKFLKQYGFPSIFKSCLHPCQKEVEASEKKHLMGTHLRFPFTLLAMFCGIFE